MTTPSEQPEQTPVAVATSTDQAVVTATLEAERQEVVDSLPFTD